MKKTVLLLALLALLPIVANAYDAKIDGIYYDLLSGGNARVTYKVGYPQADNKNAYSGKVVIPSTITYNSKQYSVTSIGSSAFSYCSGLTSITIPNSVTNIVSGAFLGCTGLTSIVVDKDNAYYDSRNNCNAIIETSTNTLITGCQNTIIPEGVTSIGGHAFSGCSNLTSITIPNSVTSIGGSAFYNCSGLTSITIPESVTSIGGSAFYGCSGLTSITIPESVTSIGSYAFNGCSGLTSIIIPESVTSIGSYAFRNCSGLTSIIIPESVTSIGDYAFYGCSGLTSLTIPEGVTSIGNSAFRECTGLTSITIPESVTSIGDYTFYLCSNLTSITIGSGVTSIGSSAFYNTAWYNNQPDGLVYAGKVAYKYKGTMADGTEIVVKEGTLTIINNTFSNCSGLKSIIIPNSVTSIGDKAFYNCTSLTAVTISSNEIVSKTYGSSSNLGTIFGSQVKEFILRKDITRIGDYAFSGCSNLTSITIPNSVTSIGSSAFNNCSGLTSVTINSNAIVSKAYTSLSNLGTIFGSQVKEFILGNDINSIGDNVFNGCSSLTSIAIPNSVTNIGYGAFWHCSGLKSITIGSGVTSIGRMAFYDCSNLTSVTLNSKDIVSKTYGSSSNLGTIFGSQVKEYILGDNIINIGDYAFYGCSVLTSFTIPNSVTSIGSSTFMGCSGLTSITIPNSVTSIGISAFNSCSAIVSIVVAEGNPVYDSRNQCNAIIETASNTLIAGCKKSVIPENVTSIGSYAFAYCSGLTSITIPNSVTSIGEDAFHGCSGLTAIIIPESVTSIGNNAFAYCSGLTSVTINSNAIVSKAYTSLSNLGTIFGSQVKEYILGDKITDIGSYAFAYCSGLTSITIPNSVTSIGEDAFCGCYGLTSVTIPNSVTSIGEDAFYGCSGLRSVTIGSSVKSIGICAFNHCSGLTSIVVDKDNTYYDSRGNCNAIIKTSSNSLICGCKNTVIPNSVTSINSFAFYKCSDLTSITIPNSVTSIGGYAFGECSSLLSITCWALSVPNTGVYCFNNVPQDSATLYVPRASIELYKSASQWKNFSNILPLAYDVKLSDIYYNINSDGTSVSVTNSGSSGSYSGSVIIPSTIQCYGKQYNVTNICSNAFSGCTGLTSITIPDKVSDIGNNAFYGCSSLTSVAIPNNVTSIGEDAFCGCYGLTSVTIPSSVTYIGKDAFPTNTNCNIYIDNSAYALGVLWDKGIIPYDKTTNTHLTVPSASRTNSSASSIRLMGTSYSDCIEMLSEAYTLNGITKTGHTASFTGLTPGTGYLVAYNATMKYGGNTLTYTTDCNMTTSELVLTTSLPKVISAGNAVVGATSNLDDAEENVGFEWRRTDWTDDFASNTGAAYLYEGTMEGYIRNLYTEKLWKVRPYYKDNNGKSYYGEWVGLDPTNTSYFEPTVHTYAKINVTGNKAAVSGYVQRGSDNVSKQGFKYWTDASGARGAGISIPSGAKTIEAEGRVMEVELTGLLPNTTYTYVAFVTTTEGETFYGKQLSFTTGEDPDATLTGDANGNGVVEIGDVTSVLTLMATPEAPGYDAKAADANKNGVIEIGDVTTILTIMAGGE